MPKTGNGRTILSRNNLNLSDHIHFLPQNCIVASLDVPVSPDLTGCDLQSRNSPSILAAARQLCECSKTRVTNGNRCRSGIRRWNFCPFVKFSFVFMIKR
jgi:hypothetical protein